MYDQVVELILKSLIILAILVVVVGLPLGDSLLRKK